MKAGIVMTGTGPILILTSYDSLDDPLLARKLAAKGIKKFIAYEVPTEGLSEKYGEHYDLVMGDLHQSDALRVLDYNGHHVYGNFLLKELGEPIFHELQETPLVI